LVVTKNIIFDLGNVIVDLDIQRTFDSLEHYLGKEGLQKAHDADLFNKYEIGAITEAAFFKQLKSLCIENTPKRALIDAWNIMLLRIPFQRLIMLEHLKHDYKVILLSNTNKTHLDWVRAYLKGLFRIQDFEQRFFHDVYYSHVIGLRKPNANIYEYVLTTSDINPQETIFIDDNKDNIEASLLLGIKGILHPIGAEVVDALPQYLVGA
jgi:glucose-1-phosphatase